MGRGNTGTGQAGRTAGTAREGGDTTSGPIVYGSGDQQFAGAVVPLTRLEQRVASTVLQSGALTRNEEHGWIFTSDGRLMAHGTSHSHDEVSLGKTHSLQNNAIFVHTHPANTEPLSRLDIASSSANNAATLVSVRQIDAVPHAFDQSPLPHTPRGSDAHVVMTVLQRPPGGWPNDAKMNAIYKKANDIASQQIERDYQRGVLVGAEWDTHQVEDTYRMRATARLMGTSYREIRVPKA